MAIGSISNGDSGSSCRDKINQGLSLWDGLVGVILPYGGSSAPSKWALCDGAAVSRSTYSALFEIIGTDFGNGDGSSTFNLPDFGGKVPVGINGGTAFAGMGVSVGEETHTLSESEMPSHTHGGGVVSVSNRSDMDNSGLTFVVDGITTGDTTSAGGGSAHNNIQPSLCVNFIIYTGV